MESLLAIRTRWLVLAMAFAVAAVGAIAAWDEHDRADGALVDLGHYQQAVAEATSRVGASALPALDTRDHRVLVVGADGRARRVDGTPVEIPGLAGALARGDRSLRLDRDDAAALGLPHRTAMLGLSPTPTGAIAVVATAKHQRDRASAGVRRIAWSVTLAAGIVLVFGGLALARQRRELELARELALRAKDAELEKLSRAATMAAIGSGVAHELSTPLGVIVGRAEQLAARANGDERLAKHARTILEQVDHIDRVVRGLLGLARGAPIAMQEISPPDLVREAAALVEHRFERAGVTLLPVVGADLPSVR
ncbi:MAG: histidine kinase dimerization/phospho-acceptor domain-containing protein, partial [Acidobacteriota bacterium]